MSSYLFLFLSVLLLRADDLTMFKKWAQEQEPRNVRAERRREGEGREGLREWRRQVKRGREERDRRGSEEGRSRGEGRRGSVGREGERRREKTCADASGNGDPGGLAPAGTGRAGPDVGHGGCWKLPSPPHLL